MERRTLTDLAFLRIAIVAYRSGDTLQRCVDALADQTFKSFEVVIVDNDCPDKCTQKLEALDGRFRVRRSEENLGFSGGCNSALLDAPTEWVMTLNPDAFLHPSALQSFADFVSENKQFTSISPMLVQAKSPDQLDGVGDCLSIHGMFWRGGYGHRVETAPKNACEVFSPCGAAAFYRSAEFQRAGGFSEHFFCYVEDVDLGLRLRAMGERCAFLPNVRVDHIGSATLGPQHDFIWYHSYRNGVWMLVQSLPLMLLPFVLTLHVVAQSWLIWRNRKSEGHHARLRGFRSGLSGVLHAWRRRDDDLPLKSANVWRWLVLSTKSVSNHSIICREFRAEAEKQS